MAIAVETGPFASEQAEGLLRRLAYQVGRSAKSPHEKEVHELRVANRRFTQALAALGACFPAKEVKKIKRRLKKIMTMAGEVRDCDIAIEMLSKSKAAPAALVSTFRKRRKEAERALAGGLKRWSQRRLYSRWRAELAGGGRGGISHDPVGVTAKAVLLPMLREFFSRGKQALGSRAPAAKTHQLRIAAKKFRYTIELFAPVYGASLDGWLEEMKALQKVLGAISDCETVRAMVQRQGGDRRIESSLQRKARRRIEEFRQLWEETFSDACMQSLVWQIDRAAPRKPAVGSKPGEPGGRQSRAAHA